MGENIGIVLAGGIGQRFGGDVPKQYRTVFGKEMIWYSIDAFRRAKKIDDFVVVLDEAELAKGRIAAEYGVKTIAGGATRNGSFKNALDWIAANHPDCEKVIENNAACPMVTPELIDLYMDFLDESDVVETCYKITDALASYKDRVANRDDFYLIQAPDAYRFPLLYRHYDPSSPLCHPAHQLPMTARIHRYFGYTDNWKVTYPHDLRIVEMLLERRRESATKAEP